MEITVVKEFSFEAAHHLPGYDGPCKNVHGHHYILQVGVKGKVDFDSGMVIDFSILKKIINQEIVDLLDHQDLNSLSSDPGQLGINFPYEMPTAENMVRWIAQRSRNRWTGTRRDGRIVFVRLYETPTSSAEWRAE